MLGKRALVAAILLPIGLAAIWAGGWYLTALVAVFMCLAAWEFGTLFRQGGLQPVRLLMVAGCLLLVVGRQFNGFESTPWMISLLILLAMTYHLVMYERGRDQAGTDFALTLAGIFYIGWLGAYFISLRNLPEGMWWLLIVLLGVMIADSGAYFIGRAYGRHLLTPRLSPKKTWEGYFGGIVVALVIMPVLGYLVHLIAGPDSGITPLRGLIIGLVMCVVPTLGDLGESMIKRQVGVKDSGNILPGHGGAFDRVDSWLWAVVLGYYMVVWLWV
jgi:phosphatidate cytidylyltransferase